jgi:hypothetical protein
VWYEGKKRTKKRKSARRAVLWPGRQWPRTLPLVMKRLGVVVAIRMMLVLDVLTC